MKLIQLNAWQGRLIRQILDFLREEQPDFICLQEIYSSDINKTGLYDFMNGLELIRNEFPKYHLYFSPCWDTPAFDRQVGFGNAILSRFPLKHCETIFINGEFESWNTPEDDKSGTRNLQRTDVYINEKSSFSLVNHHGYWEPTPMGSETTIKKMKDVADVLKDQPRPLIFAGDLNVVPESPAMQPIHAQLRNLTKEYGLPSTLSELGKVKDVACDHICVSEGIDVQSFRASQTLVSDHMALVAEFNLK